MAIKESNQKLKPQSHRRAVKIRRCAAALIFSQDNCIAIVNQNNDSWSLPKGHLDRAETALDAAIRETHEETGLLDLAYVCKLGSYRRPKIAKGGKGDDKSEIKLIQVFVFRVKGKPKLKPIDPHNPKASWVSLEKAIQRLTHPKDIAFLVNKLSFIKNKFISKKRNEE